MGSFLRLHPIPRAKSIHNCTARPINLPIEVHTLELIREQDKMLRDYINLKIDLKD